MQNLDVKELRGQNLENKGVRLATEAIRAPSGSAMIARFEIRGKVGRHMGAVEKCGICCSEPCDESPDAP
jgi:hypothetical protein